MTERQSTPMRGRTRESVRTHLRIATCYNLLMREARQRVVARWNLTLPQFEMLAELARADTGGFTFVELSRLLLVTSGNLTGIVDRLEEQRLVERRPDGKDRRVIRVALTEKGRRVTDHMLPAHAADIEEILSFMPRASLNELSSLLGHLRDGLHARAELGQTAVSRKRKASLRRVV
ncbi:MAG TPA: MarR family transcriptional regulator [Vicinamibacterales bacterium]|nr:MarR family transcriptional regulator [Vicinamibacterales bacterium]